MGRPKTNNPRTNSRHHRSSSKSRRLGLFTLAEVLAARARAYREELSLLLVAEIALVIGVIAIAPWKTIAGTTKDITDTATTRLVASADLKAFHEQQKLIQTFEDAEATDGISVIPNTAVQPALTAVEQDLDALNYQKARLDLAALSNNITTWNQALNEAVKAKQAAAKQAAANKAAQSALSNVPTIPSNYLPIPILIYHYTPSDFISQLQALKDKGYITVSMDAVAVALNHGGGLPKKPVVITFDDGYENQMTAYYDLARYGDKATFYIIDGGPNSNYCIGAGRQYNLPSQPVSGCGDQYLTWDQVRSLDQSGLIAIGAHTIDHLNLATVSEATQEYEIIQGKALLEAQLGHSVRHFAYPYGGYNQSAINLVREAGFETAVTTLPGIYQAYGSQYTLLRTRSAYDLP